MKVLWKLEKSLMQNIFTSGFTFEAQIIFLHVESEQKIENKSSNNVLIDSEGLKFS